MERDYTRASHYREALVRMFQRTLNELPDIREELVSRIRREIEQGIYVTPAKIEVAIDRLAARLRRYV